MQENPEEGHLEAEDLPHRDIFAYADKYMGFSKTIFL
jgi:homospermidine synthase